MQQLAEPRQLLSQLAPLIAPAQPGKPSAQANANKEADLRAECAWLGVPFAEPEGGELAKPGTKRAAEARKRRLDSLRDRLVRAVKQRNSTRDAQNALRRAAVLPHRSHS